MRSIELRARVGSDGILALKVPIGVSEADREVAVTVRLLEQPQSSTDREAWKRFVDETAGQWSGEPLIRPPQGDYEVREPWE